MVENKILTLFPMLAFIAGAALESLGEIFNYSFSVTAVGIISVLFLAVLMVVFSFKYSK